MKNLYLFAGLLLSAYMGLAQTNPDFIVSAHRGYSSKAPENTLSAFQMAIDAGADYFECDVQFTKDDSLIAMHDGTINRTTDGTGSVSDLNYAELIGIDAGYQTRFGDQYDNEPIPTLREILALAKDQIKVEIEIKGSGSADTVVKIVQEMEMEDQVSVIAFNYNEIVRVKQLDASIPVKYLLGSSWGQAQIDMLLDIGGEFIGPSGIANATQVALAHDNNIKILAYTHNSPESIQAAIDAGLDGIATDYPARAIAIREGKYVPENVLIADWDFSREELKTTIDDRSEFNNDATIFGDPEAYELNEVSGLLFDGVDDFLEVPVSNTLEATFEEITIMATLKLSALPSDISGSWGPVYDSDNDTYVLYADKGSSELRFKVTTDQGAQKPGIPDSILNTNTWITLFGVYDGRSAKIYLGDSLVDEHTLSGKIVNAQTAFIGKNGITGDELFEGAISELKIYNYAFSKDMIRGILRDKSLIAHWDMFTMTNDSIADLSGFNSNLAIHGEPEEAQRGAYYAATLDGIDDNYEVDASPVLDAPHTELTISAWVRFNELPAELTDAYDPIYDSDEDAFVLYSDRGNNEVRFKAATTGGAERPGISGDVIETDVWYHIAGVYTGTKAQIYLNGVMMDEHSLTGTILTGQKAFIGKNGTNTHHFNGSIGEVKVYNFAMTASELKKEATPSGLIAQWMMDDIVNGDTVLDHSGYDHHLTVLGSPVIESSQMISFAFDGVEDHLEVPSTTAPLLDSVGEQITVTAWVKLSDLPSELNGAYAPILDSDEDVYVLYGDRGNNELRFKVSTTGGAERPGIPGSDLTVDEWIFVAGVYDGVSARVYLNGELKDEHNLTGTIKTGQHAFIGRNGTNIQFFEGNIGEVSIYNYALSDEDLMELAKMEIITASVSSSDDVSVVYPNPTSNLINVQRSSNEVVSVRVLDVIGNEVIRYGATTSTLISMSANQYNLDKGIYVIELKYETSVEYLKIIIE